MSLHRRPGPARSTCTAAASVHPREHPDRAPRLAHRRPLQRLRVAQWDRCAHQPTDERPYRPHADGRTPDGPAVETGDWARVWPHEVGSRTQIRDGPDGRGWRGISRHTVVGARGSAWAISYSHSLHDPSAGMCSRQSCPHTGQSPTAGLRRVTRLRHHDPRPGRYSTPRSCSWLAADRGDHRAPRSSTRTNTGSRTSSTA